MIWVLWYFIGNDSGTLVWRPTQAPLWQLNPDGSWLLKLSWEKLEENATNFILHVPIRVMIK